MKKTKRKNRIIWFLLSFTISVVACGYVGTSLYFTKHFYPHTRIGEIDVSGMTVSQVKELIDSKVRNYQLKLVERNGAYEYLDGARIQLKPEYGNNIDEMMACQKGFDFPIALLETIEIDEQPVSFDENLLKQEIEKLLCMQEELQIPSTDAYLMYEQKSLCIVPESYGTKLQMENFNNQIRECVMGMLTELDLEQNGCYINPMKTKDDEGMIKAVAAANEYLQTEVTYQAGKKRMVFGPDQIYEMLNIDDDGNVTLPDDTLKNFVSELGNTFSTIGKKNFKTSYDGRVVSVTRGDYGWVVDDKAELKKLKKAIKNHTIETREPVYSQKAASHGKYDYGKTYVEVNLTAQHLFVYQKGEMVFETDFVSGNVSNGTVTRLGMFRLKYKQQDATLKGADYESHVNFWMPFDGGIGFHDATWRTKFGGSIYKEHGSHGCVNLPYVAAKKIYNLIKPGDPVVVYKLPGTEPKEPEKEENKKDNKKPKNDEKKEEQPGNDD